MRDDLEEARPTNGFANHNHGSSGESRTNNAGGDLLPSSPYHYTSQFGITKKCIRRFAIRSIVVGIFVYSQAGKQLAVDFKKGTPYTAAALRKNPYLGWQGVPPVPSVGTKNLSFSWRSCFKQKIRQYPWDPPLSEPGQPAETTSLPNDCLEYELDEAPVVSENWVPDVTMLRTMLMHGKDIHGNRFPPKLSNELCEDFGFDGEENGDSNKECIRESNIHPVGAMNLETVTIYPSSLERYYNSSGEVSKDSIQLPAPKVMCLVYTTADAHATRIRAIRDTWGGGFDGFLAFSTQSDPRLPGISLEQDGEESYDNMWQKVRSIFRFVGQHYLNDFDWFYIGGDDTFVLPHNLKTYLASLTYADGTDPKAKEYYVGRRYHHRSTGEYNSGGPGYVLSRATLIKFLEVIDDEELCFSQEHTSAEDVMMARCLANLGIHYIDTRDDKGRERFHPVDPGWHYNWSPKERQHAWWPKHQTGWEILRGKDCCAPDSISFHYIKRASMVRHLHALLHHC